MCFFLLLYRCLNLSLSSGIRRQIVIVVVVNIHGLKVDARIVFGASHKCVMVRFGREVTRADHFERVPESGSITLRHNVVQDRVYCRAYVD